MSLNNIGTNAQLRPLVSVVIATAYGAERIQTAMRSLALQTIEPGLYEVVVVLNGKPDGTRDLLEEWHRRHRAISVRIVETEVAGASNARNIGIQQSLGKFVTFVDDDDTVGRTFLEQLVQGIRGNSVVVAPVSEVREGSTFIQNDTYLNREYFKHLGQTVSFTQMPALASANAGKLMPTAIAREVLYQTHLKSGEDIDFWVRVFAVSGIKAHVIEYDGGARYIRQIRTGSVSRKLLDWDFGVTQRLDVIESLTRTSEAHPKVEGAIRRLIEAQTLHIARYIKAHPDHIDQVVAVVRTREIADFPFKLLSHYTPKQLVLSYAFPPTSDTSGLVMARRVRSAAEPVDVVSVAMSNIRNVDKSATKIANDFVVKHERLALRGTFENWELIRSYVERVDAFVAARIPHITAYESIYSRAMWPAAHIAAAVQVLRRPESYWIAEFSDPMLFDSSGQQRHRAVIEDSLYEEICRGLRVRALPLPTSTNLYEIVEHLAYALADQIVYTNDSQREYMLSYLPDGFELEEVRARSVVSHQPAPPVEYYSLQPAGKSATKGSKVNIGYFGVFYRSRGIGTVLHALAELAPLVRKKLHLHLYTNNVNETRREVNGMKLQDCVTVRPYVPYLKFLNLTTKMDWLLVMDAETTSTHSVNPYLPSKLSDYIGSGTPIWAIIESGSELSKYNAARVSELNDAQSIASALEYFVDENGEE